MDLGGCKMTKEEMIELAKQAGWQYAHGESGYEALWAFGKLVAEKEREECAQTVFNIAGFKEYEFAANSIRARGNNE